MDIGALIGLVITLVSVLVSLVIGLVVTVVSLAIPLAVLFVVYKQLQSGQGALVISGPALHLGQALQLAQPQPPTAKRLKRIVCRTCGGSKVVPPKTAFVYCDYCGTLCDWDFQIACRGVAKPGPAYEALAKIEAPRQSAAKTAGDRDAYAECTRRLFDAHFKMCPQSWSPRLGDPEYRSALLEHTVMQYTAAAFDTECVTLEQNMDAAVKKLQWTPAFPQPRVDRASFDRLVDAVLAHNHRFTALAEPLLDSHPDQPTIGMQRQISRSAFAQGWMPYLDKAGQDAMIAKLELGGDYIEVPSVETTERHCGGCARTLKVVAGAKKVICEDCGHTNDVERPEIQCSGCNGPVSVVWSKRTFKCPSCSMELRVD